MPHPSLTSKSRFLVRGIERRCRSSSYHKSGLWAKKKAEWKKIAKKTTTKGIVKKLKSGHERVIRRTPKSYPVVDVPHRLSSRKANHKPTRLRSSITPGTVLIILSGHFKGRRVVFLKQLKSGLLLVTGPYKLNGVPVRRVNQAYVIATSTKIDISKLSIPKKFQDEYFKRITSPSAKTARKLAEQNKKKKTKKAAPKKAIAKKTPTPEVLEKRKKKKADLKKKAAERKEQKTKTAAEAKDKKSEGEFFNKDKKTDKKKKKKKAVKQGRAADQKLVDEQLLPLIKAVPNLKAYLSTKFSLRKGQYPHALKF